MLLDITNLSRLFSCAWCCPPIIFLPPRLRLGFTVFRHLPEHLVAMDATVVAYRNGSGVHKADPGLLATPPHQVNAQQDQGSVSGKQTGSNWSIPEKQIVTSPVHISSNNWSSGNTSGSSWFYLVLAADSWARWHWRSPMDSWRWFQAGTNCWQESSILQNNSSKLSPMASISLVWLVDGVGNLKHTMSTETYLLKQNSGNLYFQAIVLSKTLPQ